MRYIKTRENAEKSRDVSSYVMSYRIRKKLLKDRQQWDASKDESDPQNQAVDAVEDAAEYSANRFTNYTDNGLRSHSRSSNSEDPNIAFTSKGTGAADTAAPSFRVHRNEDTIITPKRGNNKYAAYTEAGRRSFVSKKQAKLYQENVQKATKSGTRKAERIIRDAARSVKSALSDISLLFSAGGSIPIVIVILICSIGIAVGSAFGVFFSGQNTGSGKTMQAMVQELNDEYQEKISEFRASVNYDYLDMKGSSAVWREVIAVYAVRVSSGPDASDVASLDDSKITVLRETFWTMNEISSDTETITETVETEVEDDEGNTSIKTEEVEKTVLKIRISHKNAYEMVNEYGLSDEQTQMIAELLSEENNALWAAMLYGIYDGSEYFLASAAASRVGNFSSEVYMKGPMIWPLDSQYHTITDPFGFRIHPIKKTGQYHSGTDIGAPEGAKIYTVLPGTVTASGPAGDYGNRVIIDHGDGVSTLYAHASKLLVSVGDTVKQGDVIALVGETGAATGPHLHIEVRINNTSKNPELFLPDY